MKRLHVHIHVRDLGQSIGYYQALFGAEPSVRKGDYAKWMLDDPAVNFAISDRAGDTGFSHLGLQFDDGEQLAAVSARLDAASAPAREQDAARCCYALSDKVWSADPQGVPWEMFHTTGALDVFGEDDAPAVEIETPQVAERTCC